jgi:tetratricopeptide (TPR) repeat protein
VSRVQAVIAALCVSSIAHAQSETDPAREQARALLHEGNAKLDAGLYLDALDRFEAAYRAFPSPKLHFNIAQTLNELGRPLDALDHYERFVKDVPEQQNPEQWALAHEQIFKLQGAIASVEIQCNAVGARVTVDGYAVGATPLDRPIRLMPGPHAIVIGKAGFERQVIEATFKPGDAVTQRIKLVTEEEGAATRRAVQQAEAARRMTEERLRRSEEEARQKQRRTRSLERTTGWAVLGVGAAALFAGVILGGLSLSNSAAVESAAPGTPWSPDLSASYDRAANYRVGCWSSLAIGGAFAVAGGVLVGLGYLGAGSDRRAALLPTLSSEGAGLSVQGRF